MHIYRLRGFHLALALALGLASVAALPAPVQAGCISEYQQCGDCAKRKSRVALQKRDWRLYFEAVLDGVDCDIDLYHCLFQGRHHRYSCQF